MPDEVMAPPDMPNAPVPPPVDTGAAPQPTPLPKESFLQGVARGGAGEQYVVDATGRMTNARTTAPSLKGMLGSILAGAALGALHGATAARPGGIPSAELGGGAGAGAKAATDYLEQRDILHRKQAQEQFQQQTEARKMGREEAESAAQINHLAAQTGQMIQETKFEAENHPLDLRLKQAGLDEAVTRIQETRQTIQKNQLDIITNLAANGVDPSAVVTSWAAAGPYAKEIAQGQTLPLYNGQGGGTEHGAALFDATSLRQPLTKDVTFSTYTADKSGAPVEQRHTLKAGQGSMLDYVSAAMSGQAQLQRIMSQQKVQAETDKNRADAQEARAKAGLTEAQVDFFKKSGVNVPESYVPPANPFAMKPQEITQNLSQQGVTIPSNFAALYAAGHYKLDLSTFPARTINRPGMPPQMDKQSAATFIRTFVNPNYDENNYKAVQELEKEFASTKSGSAGGNLVSFNTAVGHLGQLYAASLALRNGDVRALNGIANTVSTQFGKPVAPNFEAIKGVLVGELGRLMKQSAPDVEEMKNISTALSAASSPEQFKGAMQQYAHAMLQKGIANINKYAEYTGELPPSTFSPATIGIFQQLGIDATSFLPQGVTVPIGQTGNISQGRPISSIPANVTAALANVGVGRHTLSDGSIWDKKSDGTITKVP